MSARQRPVRIAGCSGSASDRRGAMKRLAANCPYDHVDVITGDWLSEANMATRGSSKSDEPNKSAYEPSFLESIEPALADIAKNKIKVAVNAGASDTQKLHGIVTDMVKKKGLDLKVAWISGDEALPAVKEALKSKSSANEFINNYTSEKLRDWKYEPIYAQAYLGGLGIGTAFKNGADIVICGRVSDASPVIGAAAWWHDWDRSQISELANALVAGHLIECSTYVTGGNFSGFKELDSSEVVDIGFPIAEISQKGQVVITKEKIGGGKVDVHTCTSQLLYELQGPWYFNSDVVASLAGLHFEQLETNRVALRGVQGSLPPPTTKVGITAKGGYAAEAHYFITGLDAHEKAGMLEAVIRRNLELVGPLSRFSVLSFTLIGAAPENPRDQNAATVTFRIVAQALKLEDIEPAKFLKPCMDSIMSAYPGATPQMDTRMGYPRPIHEYFVTLMPQTDLRHIAHLPFHSNPDRRQIPIPPPPKTQTYPRQQPNNPETLLPVSNTVRAAGGLTDAAGGWAEMAAARGRSVLRESFSAWGRTVRGPLGSIVHARSGDKGSDANVGLWVRREEEWDWLRSLLSTRRMKDLLGQEYKQGKPIDRFEFPGLRAVHFLLHDHLDRGVGATSTVDFLGKNVAEFIRARWVDLPVKFLDHGKL